jgi:plasmid maintenance system antidote protein VapI
MPVEVNPDEIARKQSLGASLELCAELAGYEMDKQLQQALGVDKAQFSRWQSGTEGILWAKFEKLMDLCGNDAPLMWMVYQRGYDLHSLRKRESETEKALRIKDEELKAERAKNAVLLEAIQGRK